MSSLLRQIFEHVQLIRLYKNIRELWCGNSVSSYLIFYGTGVGLCIYYNYFNIYSPGNTKKTVVISLFAYVTKSNNSLNIKYKYIKL